MYRAMGQDDGLTFLPGAIQPRTAPRAPPILKAPRAPPILKAPPPPPSMPGLVVMDDMPTTETGPDPGSRTALYIAAGGVVVIGAVWLITRR